MQNSAQQHVHVNNMRVEFKLNLLHSLDIVVNNLLYKEDHTYRVYQVKLTVISNRFLFGLCQYGIKI